MSRRPKWVSALVVLVALVAIVGCRQPPPGAAGAGNELEGVWMLTRVDPGNGSPVIERSQPGLYMFAGSHYSAVYAPGPDKRTKSAVSFQPTDAEMAAQYATIIVNAGTYEVDGATVTFRPIIAKSPGFVGGYQTSTFRIQGDTLVLTQHATVALDGVSPPEVGGSLTLVRVE